MKNRRKWSGMEILMKALLKRFFLVLGILIAGAQGGEPLKVLALGNSFTRNATRYLEEMAEAGGHELHLRTIIVGGASLERHAEMARRNPEDEKGRYKDGKSFLDHLRAEKWDVVTLQQVSIRSHDLKSYQPFADELAALVREEAPSARLMWHETWAYRVDDPRFAPGKAVQPGEPKTQAEMYQGLHKSYGTVAAAQNAGLIPTGTAFFLADGDEKWGYRPDSGFDRKNAKRPNLPDQSHSLHVGYWWNKDKMGMDGHHANHAGEYLGSCVFAQVLFEGDVRQNDFVPKGLKPEYAAFLRETAWKAVQESGAKKKTRK